MRRFGVLFCLAALMGLGASQASAQQAMEDVIYLKDGSILRGMIIEQIPGKSLKIQMRDGNVFVYDMDKIERITKEPKMIDKVNASNKSQGVALALSLVIAGAGQIYSGEHERGIFQFGLAVIGATLVTSGGDEASQGIGALVWIGSALWSIIDAPLSADRMNRQAQFAHLFQMDAGRFVVGADPVIRRSGAGGALTIHF